MSIFRFDFKRHIGGIIGWSIFIAILMVGFMMIFKLFGNSLQPENLTAKIDALPTLIRGLLGLNSYPELSNIFVFTAYVFQFILLFSGLYAAILGAKALSGEEGKGTIEFLYAQPISRAQILWGKFFSCFVSYLIYSVIIFVVTCLLIYFFQSDLSISGIATKISRLLVCTVFTGLVYMSVGILFSALFRSNAESVSVMFAIVFITYIVGMIGLMAKRLSFLAFLSPVHAVFPLYSLTKTSSLIGLGIGVIVIILALLLSSLRYKRKDFIL